VNPESCAQASAVAINLVPQPRPCHLGATSDFEKVRTPILRHHQSESCRHTLKVAYHRKPAFSRKPVLRIIAHRQFDAEPRFRHFP
jgi:hypothetical protein